MAGFVGFWFYSFCMFILGGATALLLEAWSRMGCADAAPRSPTLLDELCRLLREHPQDWKSDGGGEFVHMPSGQTIFFHDGYGDPGPFMIAPTMVRFRCSGRHDLRAAVLAMLAQQAAAAQAGAAPGAKAGSVSLAMPGRDGITAASEGRG